MTDIAKLGFDVATEELLAATRQLDKLSASAAKAEVEAKKLERTQRSASLAAAQSAETIASAAHRAALGNKALSASERAALADTLKSAQAATSAARAADQQASAALKAAQANLQLSNAAEQAVKDLMELAAQGDTVAASALQNAVAHDQAAADIVNSYGRVAGAAGLTAGQSQAHFTNMAAQFQDIGVTAAMGMNPMLIGLQQGSQMALVMSDAVGKAGLAGAAGVLRNAFMSLVSPISLMTIGLTVAVAAVIQLAMSFGEEEVAIKSLDQALDFANMSADQLRQTNELLADSNREVAQTAVQAAAAMAVQRAGQLRSAQAELDRRQRQLTIAQEMAYGPNAVQGSSQALSLYQEQFDDQRQAVNGLQQQVRSYEADLQVLTAAMDQNQRQVESLTAAMNTARNEYARTGDAAQLQRAVQLRLQLNRLQAEQRSGGSDSPDTPNRPTRPERNPTEEFRTSMQREIQALQTETTALGMSTRAAMLYRKEQELLAQAQQQNIPITENLARQITDTATRLTNGQISAEFTRITQAADEQSRALEQQAELIGLSGLELEYNTTRQDLLNQAVRAGVIDLSNMNDEMRIRLGILNDEAMQQAQRTVDNRTAQFYHDQTSAIRDNVAALQTEQQTIGMSSAQAELFRYQQDLLAEARRANITLTDQQVVALVAQKQAEISLGETIAQQRQDMLDRQEDMRTFVTGMVSGLRQGQSAWEAFGNAVDQVITRLVDRLINDLLDSIMQVNSASGGQGGIGGFFNSLFGGSDLSASASQAMADNPQLFANGGAFTNSVVHKPTAFFAKGGQPGIMGEAGPEAIMPLERGPDGSLGVRAMGGGATEQQAVHVYVHPSGEFDTRVEGTAVQVFGSMAPAVAEAGAQLAENRIARKANRSHKR